MCETYKTESGFEVILKESVFGTYWVNCYNPQGFPVINGGVYQTYESAKCAADRILSSIL